MKQGMIPSICLAEPNEGQVPMGEVGSGSGSALSTSFPKSTSNSDVYSPKLRKLLIKLWLFCQ